ncbi:MAG TPA: GNAT family N-acetyltransferase [Paraburkholderia sp.]|jgi:predicted N-acetyltransferase YhbS|nr:GNAT family N-acetyltransferase [Paraburkholderia sp.]
MHHDAVVTFRFAAPCDVHAIRAIEFDASQRFVDVGMAGIADAPPMDAGLVTRKIAAREIVLAVCASETVVGFVMFEPQPERFYVEELDVLTSHAGQRIGAALIEQVAQLARARHVTQLTLSTYRDVPWNAPYYRRLGFRDLAQTELDAALIARRDAHTARGLDESKRVFMLRELE